MAEISYASFLEFDSYNSGEGWFEPSSLVKKKEAMSLCYKA